MELDTRKLRFCMSIDCKQLDKGKCGAEECEHPDKKKAIEEKQAEAMEVKHGRGS